MHRVASRCTYNPLVTVPTRVFVLASRERGLPEHKCNSDTACVYPVGRAAANRARSPRQVEDTLRSKAKVERDLFRSRPLLTFHLTSSRFLLLLHPGLPVHVPSLSLRFPEYPRNIVSLSLFPLSLSLFLSLLCNDKPSLRLVRANRYSLYKVTARTSCQELCMCKTDRNKSKISDFEGGASPIIFVIKKKKESIKLKSRKRLSSFIIEMRRK